jgi:hypothetical protein
MLPGGIIGNTNVTTKRSRKTNTKITAFDMMTNMLKTFIIFVKPKPPKNKQTTPKTTRNNQKHHPTPPDKKHYMPKQHSPFFFRGYIIGIGEMGLRGLSGWKKSNMITPFDLSYSLFSP